MNSSRKTHLILVLVMMVMMLTTGCLLDGDTSNDPRPEQGGSVAEGPDGDGEGTGDETDDGDTGGGDTDEAATPGEPEQGQTNPVATTKDGQGLTFSLKDASALALTSDTATSNSTNLKKIVGDEIQEVINQGAPAGSTQPLVTKDIDLSQLPGVANLFTGPQGVVVLLLRSSIKVNERDCYFIRVAEGGDDVRCLEPNLTNLCCISPPERSVGIPGGGHHDVQFDRSGNIYFVGATDGSSKLRRWNLADGSLTEITNNNITVSDYLVTPSGEVFLKGTTRVGGTSFFRRIRADGSLEDLFVGQPSHFAFADANTLLISGWRSPQDTGLYALPFTDNALGELRSVIRSSLRDEAGNDHYGASLITFQKSGSGGVFSLSSGIGRKILSVYPDSPSFLQSRVHTVTYFKIFDEDIFIVGQSEVGRYLFHKMRLGDPASEEDLLNGSNFQVYHFGVINNRVYFDALRFSDNKLMIGQIDLNDGNRMMELSPLQASLVGLEFLNPN